MPSRYLIGIDLGTTNSVVAYLDTQEASGTASPIHVLPVPQLVAHGEVRTLLALPSFLYFPTQEELSTGAVSATWDEDPPMVTGVLAREQGALVPSRQVSSAKSWLSYPGASRRAKILPTQAEPPQPMISPVEASARYLMHLRDTWNQKFGSNPETRFERQDIVLTVPASFDEEARELTVEAAHIAGLDKLTLLEEPLAAFYSWIEAQQSGPSSDTASCNTHSLRVGELILICDIGGGTTDFSLVRTHLLDGEPQFERTAIGEHLLLGGDNFDFAIAHHVEQKFAGVKLTLRQRYALRRACSNAKERFFTDSSIDRLPMTLLGSGHSVIGQSLSVDLTRDEVLQILTDGFLPLTARADMPVQTRTTGLRELGLPYASDPAITRHLAAFLAQAALTMNPGATVQTMPRPDAILFNGGFCIPEITRNRIVETISAWFDGAETGWRPILLDNGVVESSVARGAAYYGRVRRGTGQRIKVGSARTYYIELPSTDGLQGICVLPAGVEAGTTLPPLDREFSVLANRPVSFALYSSRTQHSAHGQVVALDDATIHRHAPLVSVLRYGKKLREIYLTVRLRANLTEVGTLELWCESKDSQHRWRLQFELRGEEPQGISPSDATLSDTASDSTIEAVDHLIRNAFDPAAHGAVEPDSLVSQMETTIGRKRDAWPIAALRHFSDVLSAVAEGRSISPRHEFRWLNLSGFCLRPGFGASSDDARIATLQAKRQLIFANDLQCQIESLTLLRRIAGGLSASKQQALYRELTGSLAANKSFRRNRQFEYERWRLLASLEHLPSRTRAALGAELLTKLRKDPEDAIWLWSLGRLGARIPLYGPLHGVVSPEVAREWLTALLDLSPFTNLTASAVSALARYTADSSRDIDTEIREQVLSRLTSLGMAGESILPLSKYVAPERSDVVHSFGESLPYGVDLVSSANCLLSVPALRGSSPTT